MNNLQDFYEELNQTMELIEKTPTHYFYNKLHEETGEVAEVASAFMGSEKKIRELTAEAGSLENALIEELSDSFVVLMIIARRHGFDMEDIFKVGAHKMAVKNQKRIEAAGRNK